MDSTKFDSFVARFGRRLNRRRLLQRAAQAGAGVAVVTAVGRAQPVAAGVCHHGAFTCQNGYVWRDAFAGDVVCVEPWVRDQMWYDNASQAGRYDPNGPYGIYSCVSGYVWRDAYDGDGVCVEPWVRDQVHYDNAVAGSRIEPGCALETQI